MKDTGASADADRAATPNGAEPEVSGKAGIPSAGSLCVLVHPLMLDRYVLARVVKARKLGGMWDVEAWGNRTEGPGWGQPTRRKVAKFFPLPQTVDPATVAATLREKGEAFWQEERTHRANYHKSIADYAAAIANADPPTDEFITLPRMEME